MARTKKARTAAEEETAARKRAAALEKARAARKANSHEKVANRIWTILEPRIQSSGCRCGLRKGMTLEELRVLGAGCTDPFDYEHYVLGKPIVEPETAEQRLALLGRQPGHVCSVLNLYRRYVERPALLYEKDAA
jgi:hypothetical protein